MKFRSKVLLISLVILSVCLGVIGYLMIRKNYDVAMDAAMEGAITENNLMQASVEYELLKELNTTENVIIPATLAEIGNRMAGSVLSDHSAFMIYYDGTEVYGSAEDMRLPEELLADSQIGRKRYLYAEENDHRYIYVSSFNPVNKKNLHVVSRRDLDSVDSLLNTLIQYYRVIFSVVLLLAGGLLWLTSRVLTKPLERLNQATEEIGRGHYTVRTDVHTNDEIGLLAEKFNDMASAVDGHVRELNDMVKRRDQFVADFTHEIKTPMTAIIGYADTMRSMNLDRDEQMTALTYIFSEGKRLEAMSQKLFDLIYLRNHAVETKPLFVPDLAEEIRTITAPLLETRKLSLQVEVDPGRVTGDRALLITAFVNMIDNARKASEEGMTVELKGHALDDGYDLCVTDHGRGMTEEQRTRICDEFYMADKSRSRKEGGAGLGMSLVAIILERHGADLTVDSALGMGTTMTVHFPAEEESGHEK